MLLNILRRTKWVDLDLLLVYFMISYLTEPLNHLKPRIITLCPYSLDYENMLFLISLVSRLFNLLTWGVTFLEMGLLGPLLDLNLISVFSFFTAAIADKKKLLKHQKLDKIRNDFPVIWTCNLCKELFISL